MGFNVRTRDEIVAGYLRDIRHGTPKAATGENSDAWVRAQAIANALLPIHDNAVKLANEAIPTTASEAGLGRAGRTYGVPKLGDFCAAGTVHVRGSFVTVVADGNGLVNPATGVRYRTVGDVLLAPPAYTGVLFVVALEPGVRGNVDPSTALQFEATPPGVESIAVVESISGGDAAWSNARWAKEILRRMRQAPRAGNVAHFLALGLCVPGVEQLFVYPALRGRGTMDVCVVTSAASGSRVAGIALLTKVGGALQFGARAPGGEFVPGIAEDVFANTNIVAAVAQPTELLVAYRASATSPFAAWPPFGPGQATPSDVGSWYRVGSATSLVDFVIARPTKGLVVPPPVGATIGAFHPSVGFAKTRILAVTPSGADWRVTVQPWAPSPKETTVLPGTTLVGWNAQLPAICGPPRAGSLALSGAVADYFAALGPGEMTPLTAKDRTRRRRWPRSTDTDPLSGRVEWPTDVTTRLGAAIASVTDAIDLEARVMSGFPATPFVPLGAYIGAPPSILVPSRVHVIPLP